MHVMPPESGTLESRAAALLFEFHNVSYLLFHGGAMCESSLLLGEVFADRDQRAGT